MKTMGVHAIWVPCRCGCGCGHRCNNRYGPYFINSTRNSSEYLGSIDAAAEKMSGENPEAAKMLKEMYITKALSSAMSAKARGFKILPPSERGPHLAKVHTWHDKGNAKTTVKRTRRTKISPGTQEFWEQFVKARDKLIPQTQGPSQDVV